MYGRPWAVWALLVILLRSVWCPPCDLWASEGDGLISSEEISLEWQLLQETVQSDQRPVWTRVLLDLNQPESAEQRTIAQTSVSPKELECLSDPEKLAGLAQEIRASLNRADPLAKEYDDEKSRQTAMLKMWVREVIENPGGLY